MRRIGVLILLLPLLLIHRVALGFDRLIFRNLEQTLVRSPLFIVGIPRSGTTLMHRLVASASDQFTTFPLWELLLAPALCEKWLVRGFASVDRWFGNPIRGLIVVLQRRLGGSLNTIHPTRFDAPEEDSLGLLPFGGCFLAVLLWPHDERVWELAYLDSRMSATRRRKLMRAYRGLVLRHLAFRGSHLRLVSKNPNHLGWVDALITTFPDASFLGLRRDPTEAVPSQLSSLKHGLAFFGNDVQHPRIRNAFVGLLADHWRRLDELSNTLPKDRFRKIDYRELRVADGDQVADWLRQLGYPLSDQDCCRITAACRQGSGYRSRHNYSLSEFGLTEASIAEAFAAYPKNGRHEVALSSQRSDGDSPAAESLFHRDLFHGIEDPVG